MQRDLRKETDTVFRRSRSSHAGISIHVINKKRKCVCGLRLSSGKLGTGFFGVLECGDKIYKGLFTCNHLIDKNDLRFGNRFIVETYSSALELEVQGFWFTDDDLDATFIELTKVQIRRLKVSDFLLMDYSLEQGDTIFLLQCPRDDDIRFASGVTVVDNEDENMFYHNCDTDRGSSGSPLLNQDGEVLGIHCGVDNDRDFERKYAVRIAAVRNAIKKNLPPAKADDREKKTKLKEERHQVPRQQHQQPQQDLPDKQRNRPEAAEREQAAATSKVSFNITNSNLSFNFSNF